LVPIAVAAGAALYLAHTTLFLRRCMRPLSSVFLRTPKAWWVLLFSSDSRRDPLSPYADIEELGRILKADVTHRPSKPSV
jgi:hypothetical protein